MRMMLLYRLMIRPSEERVRTRRERDDRTEEEDREGSGRERH